MSNFRPERISGPEPGQLLYFTSSSLALGGRFLVSISEANGSPNLMVRGLPCGSARILSDNTKGFLRSYVYFNGQSGRGFGKASASLHADSGCIYYLQDWEIRCVDLDGGLRVISELPRGQISAFTHVSSDGRWLCVPTVDEEAFGDLENPKSIPDRIRERNLSSWLRIYDTRSGELAACERIPGAWVTHVQFSPADPHRLLYNHEYSRTAGEDRMRLWDGREHRRLRPPGTGRRPGDWVCHEMWERDGSAVIYHGRFEDGPCFLGRVGLAGGAPRELALDGSWNGYGHFTVGAPGRLVSDGYYRGPDDPPGTSRGRWISLVHADWLKGTLSWHPLCEHHSSWQTQDVHPHPIFDPEGRNVYFNSDCEGTPAVYRVHCGDEGSTGAAT